MAKSTQNNHQELEPNLATVMMITLVITVTVYVILWPLKTSYLGVLLYQRGFTQYLVVILASFVIATTINKFIKISSELKDLKGNWLPENISFDDYQNPQLRRVWLELARSPRIIAVRCSRIIGAYLNSGSRKAATELALDDSSFYLSASESSYALPRILVWAIPLLGFIGTVLGISKAVNGFSTFLENTAEIDQIKEGIGSVTSGLAVAFDTTLLALFLSVVVMIPLVLVERLESRLLLQIDVYINDKLLPKLREKETQPNLNPEKITLAVGDAIKENLPTPEQLIQPAEKYAQKAAQTIAKSFLNELGEIQAREKELIQAIKQVNLMVLDDREEFMSSFSQQQKLNYQIIQEIEDLILTIKDNSNNLAHGFKEQTVEISTQLNQAASNLENKIEALEIATSKIAELNQMHSTLEKIVSGLEKTGEMEEIFASIRENILSLPPILKQLGKPRIIKLVEQIEQDRGLE